MKYSAFKLKWMLRLYPPLFFSRVWVAKIADDFSSAEVILRRSLLNRNFEGSAFGGSIFSAGDPFMNILYWQSMYRKGLKVHSWLKEARIEYLKPAKTDLLLRFTVSEAQLDEAIEYLKLEGKFSVLREFEAVDNMGEVCARFKVNVFLKLKGVSSKFQKREETNSNN